MDIQSHEMVTQSPAMITSVFSLKLCKKRKYITRVCIFAVVFDYSFAPNCRGRGRIKCTRGEIIKVLQNEKVVFWSFLYNN